MANNSDFFDSEYYKLRDLSIYSGLHSKVANKDTNEVNNKQLNRYTDIIPYDTGLVKLRQDKYINASFIEGNKYIASQGPLDHTIGDFWQMIIDNNIEVIVMVTGFVEGGRRKCAKYLPLNEGDKKVINISNDEQHTITMTKLYSDDCYTHRELRIDSGRVVNHIYFNEWPDHGVPDNKESMIKFINKVNEFKTNSPILVHCSAGVGRTGVFIVTHSLQGKQNTVDSINKFIIKIRKNRNSRMVQTVDQYKFIFDVLGVDPDQDTIHEEDVNNLYDEIQKVSDPLVLSFEPTHGAVTKDNKGNLSVKYDVFTRVSTVRRKQIKLPPKRSETIFEEEMADNKSDIIDGILRYFFNEPDHGTGRLKTYVDNYLGNSDNYRPVPLNILKNTLLDKLTYYTKQRSSEKPYVSKSGDWIILLSSTDDDAILIIFKYNKNEYHKNSLIIPFNKITEIAADVDGSEKKCKDNLIRIMALGNTINVKCENAIKLYNLISSRIPLEKSKLLNDNNFKIPIIINKVSNGIFDPVHTEATFKLIDGEIFIDKTKMKSVHITPLTVKDISKGATIMVVNDEGKINVVFRMSLETLSEINSKQGGQFIRQLISADSKHDFIDAVNKYYSECNIKYSRNDEANPNKEEKIKVEFSHRWVSPRHVIYLMVTTKKGLKTWEIVKNEPNHEHIKNTLSTYDIVDDVNSPRFGVKLAEAKRTIWFEDFFARGFLTNIFDFGLSSQAVTLSNNKNNSSSAGGGRLPKQYKKQYKKHSKRHSRKRTQKYKLKKGGGRMMTRRRVTPKRKRTQRY